MGVPAGHVAIYMSLQQYQQVVSGLNATTGAVNRLSAATNRYGARANWSRQKIFLWNQAMFTLRRLAYGTTIALVAGTAAAVKWGFEFNASMENNRLAFEQFLGSVGAANQELGFLYNLAKYTPFEFTDVTDAARRFLAFGYSLTEANKALRVIGDTVAAFGGGAEQIQRMVLVFGQIRASGRLLGQDMLQLEQQGIPVIDILLKQLHQYGITRQQLARVGELGIPAEVGIPALMRGMQEMFGGAAARQARTFSGQVSTLRDNIRQLFGALTLSRFNEVRRGLLPGLNRMFGEIGDLIQKQKGQISIEQVIGIAQRHYPGLTVLLTYLKQLYEGGRNLAIIFRDAILPALMDVSKVMAVTILPIVMLLNQSFGLMGHHVNILRIILTYLIAVWTIEKTAMIIAYVWQQKYLARLIISWSWERATVGILWLKILRYRALIAVEKAATAWNWALVASGRAQLAVQRAIAIMMGRNVMMYGRWNRFDKLLRNMRFTVLRLGQAFAASGAYMLANPIVLIIVAVIALIALLVVLYFKWRWFHNLVNNTANWVINHWKLVVAVIATINAPLAITIFILVELIKHFRTLVRWAKDAWGWVSKIWNRLGGKYVSRVFGWAFGGGGGGVPDMGGQAGALAGVQPAGRPIHVLSVGQMRGLSSEAAIPRGMGGGAPDYVQVNNNIQIDGKTIARQVAKYKLNAEARE